MRRAALFSLLATTLLALPAAAELQWDAKEASLKIRATDAEGHVRFGFVNRGEKPVTITGIHPGCGCTVPALAKNTFAPGERGELAVRFEPRNKEGLNRLPIEVSADDGSSTRLELVADIEPLVSFDLRYVFWKGAEARTPKRMRMTFAAGQSAQIAEVHSNNPGFAVACRALDGSERSFEIEVTPPAEERNYTAIRIRALIGPEKAEREFTVVARTM